ncbi:hypothetical protein D3C80_1871460 [compost metagenome]
MVLARINVNDPVPNTRINDPVLAPGPKSMYLTTVWSGVGVDAGVVECAYNTK